MAWKEISRYISLGVNVLWLNKGTLAGKSLVKRPEREADHSSQSSAEVKNAWSYNFTQPVRLHGVVITLCLSYGQMLEVKAASFHILFNLTRTISTTLDAI
jgi:hypothetical protein